MRQIIALIDRANSHGPRVVTGHRAALEEEEDSAASHKRDAARFRAEAEAERPVFAQRFREEAVKR